MNNAKLIAYYLPQFHSIPENDNWWGVGFTEWTNVKNATPLFKGHNQPKKPGRLGYYNLLDKNTQRKQIELAKQYDIYGFCYYHYWFGNGKLLLEKPLELMLKSKELDLPFSISWANESWEGIWHGSPGKQLIKQEYPGKKDIINHFKYLLKFFDDSRYIKIDDKPIFTIHRPDLIPDLDMFVDVFRNQAHNAGISGIYLIGGYNYSLNWKPKPKIFDALISNGFNHAPNFLLKERYNSLSKRLLRLKLKLNINKPLVYNFEEINEVIKSIDTKNKKEGLAINNYFPLIISNWDNTPRLGRKGYLFDNFTDNTFKKHINYNFSLIKDNTNKLIFIKSWNEWAEGNYLEPDEQNDVKLLTILKSELKRFNLNRINQLNS